MNTKLNGMERLKFLRNNPPFFLIDTVLFILSIYVSFLLRFEFKIPQAQMRNLYGAVILFPIVKLVMFKIVKLYKVNWSYIGLKDAYNCAKANMFGSLIIALIIYYPLYSYVKGFPISIVILDLFLSTLFTNSIRISKRIFFEAIKQSSNIIKNNTLIIGAGKTGETIVRDLIKSGYTDYYPVGFLDDNVQKIGSYIHRIEILGEISELSKFAKKYEVQSIIIAIPALDYKKLQKLYFTAKKIGIKNVKIVQNIYGIDTLKAEIKSLQDIMIEDLLGRQAVSVDYKEIASFIDNRIVLVTGAAGSIGSEISYQICKFNPKIVVLFEIDETEIFNLERKLKKDFGNIQNRIIPVVGDITDTDKLNKIFETYKPDIVFHSAAYKHVPVMEFYPEEAIKVNILGTNNLVKTSIKYDVEKFIFISTDKAVEPTNIMGATKRFSEYLLKTYNDFNFTKFVSVRFGNVLGSRGSVLPIFLEQLQNGGPLTITHSKMKRYFMTIPEAVSLVLQASVIGEGGDAMILDMGDQISIVELAEQLIRLNGLEPYRDIDIVFTGARPGEKLFEELFTGEEKLAITKHNKIFKTDIKGVYSLEEINAFLHNFMLIKENYGGKEEYKKLLNVFVKIYEDVEGTDLHWIPKVSN